MSQNDEYVCPVCDGAGSLTKNPSSIGDPQCEVVVRCFCGGDGYVFGDQIDEAWTIAKREFGRQRPYELREAEECEFAGFDSDR